MIKQLKKKTIIEYKDSNVDNQANLAVVVIESTSEQHEYPQTTITIKDSQDYDYIHSDYSEELDEETVVKLVNKAFEQAALMKHAPSKYGEDIPDIELDD